LNEQDDIFFLDIKRNKKLVEKKKYSQNHTDWWHGHDRNQPKPTKKTIWQWQSFPLTFIRGHHF